MIETQLAGKFQSVSYSHAHGNCYQEYGNNFQDQHNSLLVLDARWGKRETAFPYAFFETRPSQLLPARPSVLHRTNPRPADGIQFRRARSSVARVHQDCEHVTAPRMGA